MNTKVISIVTVIFMIAGAVLLGVSILGSDSSKWVLPAALICIFMANLLNLISAQKSKKES